MDLDVDMADMDVEAMQRCASAAGTLRAAKIKSRAVFGAWPAYESDRVLYGEDGGQADVIIFVNDDLKPCTCLIVGDRVEVHLGWDGDPRVPRVRLPGDGE
jgi:hypothetical protein